MNIVNEIVSDLDKVRNLFKNVLGGTLGVLSSPQLDSIKIALVTAAIQSGTKFFETLTKPSSIGNNSDMLEILESVINK